MTIQNDIYILYKYCTCTSTCICILIKVNNLTQSINTFRYHFITSQMKYNHLLTNSHTLISLSFLMLSSHITSLLVLLYVILNGITFTIIENTVIETTTTMTLILTQS